MGSIRSGHRRRGAVDNIGAWFKKGDVPIRMEQLEPAAFHATAMGTDVAGCVRAEHGVGLMAEAEDMDGFAIVARGRLASDQVGRAAIAKGSDMVVVPCGHVGADTHIQVTVRNDIGALVTYVDVSPGNSFTVHFDRKTRADGSFTYSMIEIAPAEAYPL